MTSSSQGQCGIAVSLGPWIFFYICLASLRCCCRPRVTTLVVSVGDVVVRKGCVSILRTQLDPFVSTALWVYFCGRGGFLSASS